MANTYRRMEAKMKKTIGICFFAGILLMGILGAFFFLKGSGETERPEELQVAEETEQLVPTERPEAAESMNVQKAFRYIIRETNGVLVVYEKDGETVLLETNIKVEHLDAEAREAFEQGIFIEDERELYDLLESYSS